jgi:hypothetical protein
LCSSRKAKYAFPSAKIAAIINPMRTPRQGWLKLVTVLFLTNCALAFGAEIPHPGRFREKRWTVPSGKCALSRFSIGNYDHEQVNAFGKTGRARGAMMAASVETSDPSCLKEYGVVQYIRGCMYNVRFRREENRVVDRYFGIVREQRGRVVPFVFRGWDVDTVDGDPLYHSNSDSDAPSARFDHHRFAKKPLSLASDPASVKKDGKIFFDPKHYGYLPEASDPRSYFVTDLPSLADWTPNSGAGEEEWVNASLEFQTCIYRTKDIPNVGNPAPPSASSESGGPLACFSWNHKQSFNPVKNMFEPHSGIDPACSAIPVREIGIAKN